MFLKPEDAKTKWCPMAITASVHRNSRSINRTFDIGSPRPDCLCLADDCMAWRRRPDRPDHGYCGLAPLVLKVKGN
jgi:hypothetical protein